MRSYNRLTSKIENVVGREEGGKSGNLRGMGTSGVNYPRKGTSDMTSGTGLRMESQTQEVASFLGAHQRNELSRFHFSFDIPKKLPAYLQLLRSPKLLEHIGSAQSL